MGSKNNRWMMSASQAWKVSVLLALLLVACVIALGTIVLVSNGWHFAKPGAGVSGADWWRMPVIDKSEPKEYFAFFLSMAGWVQAVAAVLTLVVAALALVQVSELKEQNRLAKDRARSESYRILISDRFVSIKRFLHDERVRNRLNAYWLDVEDICTADTTAQRKRLQEALDELRRDIARLGKGVQLPLLNRPACLDDIEALINEYNYLSKQLNEGSLDLKFNTDLGVENFKNLYLATRPLILGRRLMSSSYAQHFVEHVAPSDGEPCKTIGD